MTPTQIQHAVRKAARSKGLSIRAYLIARGVNPSTYYRWLSGERSPNTSTLARVL